MAYGIRKFSISLPYRSITYWNSELFDYRRWEKAILDPDYLYRNDFWEVRKPLTTILNLFDDHGQPSFVIVGNYCGLRRRLFETYNRERILIGKVYYLKITNSSIYFEKLYG
ncbi:hypothetical protein WA026_006246 [Henosepilachna vigintioctopunctata]|uniref:Uncharacterized protein n=1 Tax=Henosepilachna vigintioctopunctata TaxID=420089 RepID=A0AAW1TP97_9CUCU